MNIKFKPFNWQSGNDWARSENYRLEIRQHPNGEVYFEDRDNNNRFMYEARRNFFEIFQCAKNVGRDKSITELMIIAEQVIKSAIIREFFEVTADEFNVTNLKKR